ncbi:MAG: hypothetical protein LBH96_00005, partial [Candidatus Peribacteria bacterium]|nr:hypothetical protein [Candidatus Peribacteria bacterium]
YKKLITNSYNTHFLQANLADFLHNTSLRGETQSEAKGSDVAIQTNSRLLRSARNDNIILVANLPYIPDETFDNNALENVQKREPRLAFVGGDDGLDLYREMFNQMLPLYNKKTENSDNKQGELIMFLEMMTRQVEILRQEFGNRLKFEEVKTFHFNIRIVKARIK